MGSDQFVMPEINYSEILQKNGIIRLDFGKLTHDINLVEKWNWQDTHVYTVSSYEKCLHNTINRKFIEKINGNTNPINCLFDACNKDNSLCTTYFPYNDSAKKDFVISIINFNVEKKYINHCNNITEEYLLQKKTDNVQTEREQQINNINQTIDDILRDLSIPDINNNSTGQELNIFFKSSQNAFTNIVGSVYNSLFAANVVECIKIVIFYYNIQDTAEIIFSNFAIILCNSTTDLQNNELNYILHSLAYEGLNNEIQNKNKEIRKTAVRSAIIAIMSRNMSHNLGSHVITNTRYQIENLSAKSDKNIQKQLNGVAALLEYLQERQDFIAVIANEEQYAKGPLNFKTAVFDMLAMDGPAKRHNRNNDYQIHNYVLDNIVRSEEIYRDDDITEIEKGKYPIEIQMVKVNRDDILIFKSNPKSATDNADSSNFTDIQLAVPYGLNGRQAFLVILENIIRNAAKHNKNDLKSDLTFSIIIEETGNKYKITIADNKQNYNTVIEKFTEKNNEQNNDKKILSSEGKLKKINILNKLNKDKDTVGGIDRNNKGIKEMLITLSWLTSKDGKVEYHKIENDDNYNDSLLKLVGVDKDFKITNEGTDLSLGYQFEIDKYLEFYEVTDDEIQKIREKQNNDSELFEELAKLTSAFIYVFPTNTDSQLLDKVKKHLTRVVTDDWKNIQETEKHNKIIPLYENLIKDNLYNGKDLPVLIAENKTNTEYSDCEQRVIRKEDTVKVENLHQGNDYILYINHYENRLFKEKNITEEEKAAFKIAKFVEGISGGNFTHNLIRTKIDKLGYLKIIEAALTKIAIVDERIFGRFGGVIKKGEEIMNKVKVFKQQADKTKPFMFYSHLKNIFPDIDSSYNVFVKQEIADNFDDNNKLTDIFTTNFIKDPNGNNYYDYFVKKNIFIFNSQSNNNLELVDLNGNVLSNAGEVFDFISIHLGLIDKIKDAKNTTAEGIIEEFKAKFPSSKLIVHSGRGGLVNTDNVGFTPFSGIDWAVDNCKYVLAELFYGQIFR